MDQLEEIMAKCAEIGKLIALTPTYQDFKRAEYSLLHDTEARKLVEDLQKMQQDQYRRQMAGTETSQEEEQKLKDMEAVCLKNPQVQLSNNANLKFQNFMEKISGKIKEGIKSVDKA